MKIAKPRNETSPNFKAFSSTTTEVSEKVQAPSQTSINRKIHKSDSPYSLNMPTHVDMPHSKPLSNQGFNNFSIGKTISSQRGKNYVHNPLESLVNQFSQDLLISTHNTKSYSNCEKRINLIRKPGVNSSPSDQYDTDEVIALKEKNNKTGFSYGNLTDIKSIRYK